MTDFNKATRDWLLTCPFIIADKAYFQYVSIGSGNQSFQTSDAMVMSEDVTGAQSGLYSLTIVDFRSLSKEPVAFSDENETDLAKVTQINRWIEDQNRAGNRPVFEGYTVEKVSSTATPAYSGADTTTPTALAKYLVAVGVYFEE